MSQILRVKVMVIAIGFMAGGWSVNLVNAEDKQAIDQVQAKDKAVKLTSQPTKSTATLQPKEIKQPFYPAVPKRTQEIQQALNSDTKCDFPDVPLSEVLQSLQTQHGINMYLDAQALKEQGLTADEPINVSLNGISLKSALNIILEPIGLDYVIDNEVLKITTAEKVARTFKVRIYPVADLCNSPEDYQALENLILNTCLTTGKPQPKYYPVGDLVIGGAGSIKTPLPSGTGTIAGTVKALVINQTDRVHTKITDLLSQLRQVRKDQAGISPEKN